MTTSQDNSLKRATRKVIATLGNSMEENGNQDYPRFLDGEAAVLQGFFIPQFARQQVEQAAEEMRQGQDFVVQEEAETYKLGKQLGRGSWGRVFEAGQDLAIKFIEPNEQARKQIEEQGINLATIIENEGISRKESRRAPHVVPRDVKRAKNGTAFLVMPRYEKFLSYWIPSEGNHSAWCSRERVVRFARDIASGLAEIHGVLGRAYGDLKPDNVAVDEDGTALIADLGTSSIGRTIGRRGLIGCEYTRAPENWDKNNGHPTKAGDVWAFGSLLTKMFTGKFVFQNEIDSNNDPLEFMSGLTEEKYNQIVRQRTEGIPRIWRGLARRCLAYRVAGEQPNEKEDIKKRTLTTIKKCLPFEYQTRIRDGVELVQELEKVTEGFGEKLKRRALASVRPLAYIVGTGAAMYILQGGCAMVKRADKYEQPPTAFDLMKNAEAKSFALEDLTGFEKENLDLELYEPLKKAIKGVNQFSDLEKLLVEANTTHGHNIHRMDKRLISSLLRATLVNKKSLQRVYKEERVGSIFVPKKFILLNDSLRSRPLEEADDYMFSAYGTMYLKTSLGYGNNIADVFANYFCTNEEINSARMRTGSVDFFPTIKENPDKEAPLRYAGARVAVGYGKFLPSAKREVIETAMALYRVTDKDGNIDPVKVAEYINSWPQARTRIAVPQPNTRVYDKLDAGYRLWENIGDSNAIARIRSQSYKRQNRKRPSFKR